MPRWDSLRVVNRLLTSLCLATSALLVGATLTACAGGGSDGATPTNQTSSATQNSDDDVDGPTGWAVSDCSALIEPTNESQPPEGSTIEGAVAVAGSIDEAPVVAIEGNAAPATSLTTIDLIPGEGPGVAPGAEVTVQYCGIGLTTRTVFDSSWSRGEPITFPLAGVIPGWQEGIPGMQPGGRRLLIIPADLAYGQNPPTPAILPGETLVFVVDLLAS